MIRVTTATAATMAALALTCCAPPAETPAEEPDAGAAKAGPAASPAPAPAAAASQAGQVRVFRDWMAVCDNANRCVALTGMAGDGAWLKVDIPSGPDARPVVTYGAADFRSGETAARPSLSIDGRAAGTDPVADLGRGRRGVITAYGRARPVSLGGAAAALLWIDERQGRLDTPTALVRRGVKPASAVPEGPERPEVTALRIPGVGAGVERPLPAALEALPAVKECRVDVPDGQARTWRIGVEKLLWEVPCWRGAYNGGSRLFIAGPDGSDAYGLGLPVARGEPTPFVVNGDFDPETGLLTSFDKGRGVGDCGVARTWAWTGRGFVLTREAAMEECWGLSQDDWPVVYEAVVR